MDWRTAKGWTSSTTHGVEYVYYIVAPGSEQADGQIMGGRLHDILQKGVPVRCVRFFAALIYGRELLSAPCGMEGVGEATKVNKERVHAHPLIGTGAEALHTFADNIHVATVNQMQCTAYLPNSDDRLNALTVYNHATSMC